MKTNHTKQLDLAQFEGHSDSTPHTKALYAECRRQREQIKVLREALERITTSEPLETESFVCDFDTLQNEARAALKATE